jgi:error-prone DNA polymerase
MARYAELQVTTNFSFLRGASHPHELVQQAAALGHAAIAITDRNSLAGIVRAHLAARDVGLHLLIGARLDFRDGTESLLCFPTDRAAYGRLSRLLTQGKRRTPKGDCHLDYADLLAHGEGQIIVAIPPENPVPLFAKTLDRLHGDFSDRLYLVISHAYRGDDARRLHDLAALAGRARIPLVATNDVLYHHPERRRLQDVVTCVREKCTIDEAGFRLAPNAERHLKTPSEMARLFRACPDALARSLEIVERCRFNLDELRYEYPEEIAPNGEPPQARLTRLTWEGAQWRYPQGIPEAVRTQIAHELKLIEKRDYAPFFLTVEDIVRFARGKEILHQGRGSAANSAVCYVLGITEVDPARSNCLFERFISDARHEPPDIDVDFEHERREEVIQYVYNRFGRERAGLTATVICYRTRGAIREVGKAFGLSPDVVSALSSAARRLDEDASHDDCAREAGLDLENNRLRLALDLAEELMGFPRHLSQHPGGFVIARGRLDELAPIENAAMDERTLISWDKDDIEALGMLKVDVLALGMLTCLAKSFALLKTHYGKELSPATVPPEDPAVYAMLSRADSVGVFQVESRAQQSMLPRLKPQTFYDLVIEVAIVRPGPIQGQMVHPYLRRRGGLEPVTYPKEELREVLHKTLGVPLFQEQCMRIAIVAAGFSPTEADGLRRAMATFKRMGTIHTFRDKFIEGMVSRGYERAFATRCFSQIQGFGTYGFPESHAASFALLVYVSAWIKCHYPDVFACAIMNSQPMGFYAPAQLVRDAREHGVEIRPVDVNHSVWDHTLEPRDDGRYALRLGFRLVAGLSEADATRLIENRGPGYVSTGDLVRRSGLGQKTLQRLVQADTLSSLTLDRRQGLWLVSGAQDETLPLFAGLSDGSPTNIPAALPPIAESQAVAEDYIALGLSLKPHPLTFLRPMFEKRGLVPASALHTLPDKSQVALAGLVLFRQQPGTAKGTIFMTLEDETGAAQLIVWPKVSERFRRAVYGARLLFCTGVLQREGQVIHVVTRTLEDWSGALRSLHHGAGDSPKVWGEAHTRTHEPIMPVKSRDFR